MDWSEIIRTALSIVGAVGGVTGALALWFNRRDAARTRAASLPTATVLLNPNKDASGGFVIKLTFSNVSRSFVLTRAKLIRPRHGKIARLLRGETDGETAKSISVKWPVNPPVAPGGIAAVAHLRFTLRESDTPSLAALHLFGRYNSGLQEAVKIRCNGRVG